MKKLVIGVTVPCLVNFVGCVEMLYSIKSKHNVEIKIMDQWRDQKPLSRAWNLGAQALFDKGCEYVAIVNDDVLFGPDCLDNLVTELAEPRDPSIILVSATNLYEHYYNNANLILDHRDSFDDSVIADHPNYSTFMIGKNFFDLHGTFDENFYPAWKEDQDSHRRIQLLGYRAICTTAASSVHYGGVTTAMLGGGNSNISHAYFLRKWGADWPNEVYTHPYNDDTLSPKEWRSDE